MFIITFETENLKVVIEDKTAGDDLRLTDALLLVEQGLRGLGYVWDGELEVVGGEEADYEPTES